MHKTSRGGGVGPVIDFVQIRIESNKTDIRREIRTLENTPEASLYSNYVEKLNNKISKKGNAKTSNQAQNKCFVDRDQYEKELEKIVYGEEWTLLNPLHRLIKINQYLKSLPNIKPSEISTLSEFLKERLPRNRTGKQRFVVEYDKITMKILDIDAIFYDEENSRYDVVKEYKDD